LAATISRKAAGRDRPSIDKPLADFLFSAGGSSSSRLRVLEQIGCGLIEILLEACHILLQHAKGVEGAVVSNSAGWGTATSSLPGWSDGPAHGAERRLVVGRMALRVGNPLEPRCVMLSRYPK